MSGLSNPVQEIKSHYDVVVVGSGYGGAIAASRLARARRTVCVLERGREFAPGDFPDTAAEAAADVQVDTPRGRIGNDTALFDFHVGEDVSVLVGCGLGGTSLINANVSLAPDSRVFEDPSWPRALRADRGATLEEGYRRAREMLRPVPYPTDLPVLPKAQALEKAAAHLGLPFYHPPINVTFEAGVNHVGVDQGACNLCGDCVSGCNNRAKNTVAMNYLPDARNHGAEIYTRVSVRRVERARSRWLVHFQLLDLGREHFDAPAMFVTADVVVLAAGTLGSTEILLRSKASGLPLSDRVGYGFSGNGDVLGFGYNCDVPVEGVGFGAAREPAAGPVGPCITGIIDDRAGAELGEGMVIEEGAIPGALKGLLPEAFAVASRLVGEDTDEGLGDFWRERKREITGLFGDADGGAVRSTITYLVMSHDGGDGRLVLEKDRIRVVWPEVGSRPVFERVNKQLQRATGALGGTYVRNPVWSSLFKQDIVTVHPLGGCVMGEDAAQGVVDHKGRVFSGPGGDGVHDGLYVLDGSIIPRPLGVNPLLTISALAERGVALLAADREWSFGYDFPEPPPRPVARAVGVEFTESMAGFVSHTDAGDFEAAARRGLAEDSTFRFVLTIYVDDSDRLSADPSYDAHMVGTVVAPVLSDAPLTVTDGTFNLFVDDTTDPATKHMRYRMAMSTTEGRSFSFSGFKVVRDDPGLDLWADTTTLYATIREGPGEESPVVARGVLKILPRDFLQQLTTMRAVGAADVMEGLAVMERFGLLFAGSLFETYGGLGKLLRNKKGVPS